MWISILKYKMCVFFVSIFYSLNYLHKSDLLQRCIIVTNPSGYWSHFSARRCDWLSGGVIGWVVVWLVEVWPESWVSTTTAFIQWWCVVVTPDGTSTLLLQPFYYTIQLYFSGLAYYCSNINYPFYTGCLNGNVYYVMGISISYGNVNKLIVLC